MPSGAGLNRVVATVLTVDVNTAIASTPFYGKAASYGIIGVNDSGMVLNEAANFTKWTISLTGDPTNYGFTFLGTNDPTAIAAWRQGLNPGQYPNRPTLPASSWFLVPGPSDQSGTGADGNPLTAANPVLTVSRPLLAVRVVLSASGTPTGRCSVQVEAVP